MSPRSERILSALDAVFRCVLGGIFIYAAWSKIQDPGLFASQVAAYRMLPGCLVSLVALVLPMVELLSGIVLIATRWPREAALLILGMLGMFFIGLTQGIVRGLKISCGCFAGGDEESGLVSALLRDIVLLAPTVWLVLRPNRWLSRRLPWLGVACVVLGFGLWAAASSHLDARQGAAPSTVQAQGEVDIPDAVVAAANGEKVPAEKWTLDFPQALAQARTEHRPLILYAGQKNCRFCQQMEPVVKGPIFARWIKGTGMYLAEAHLNETNANIAQHYQVEFMRSLRPYGKLVYPYFAIYWPRGKEQGDIQTVFTARRGLMPGRRHLALIGELLSACDLYLAGYLNNLGKRPSFDQLAGYKTRQVNIVSSDGSKVWMTPESGVQELGSKVTLHVKPNQSAVRPVWKSPDGRVISHQNARSLVVTDDMPSGTYRVEFKKLTVLGGSGLKDETSAVKD